MKTHLKVYFGKKRLIKKMIKKLVYVPWPTVKFNKLKTKNLQKKIHVGKREQKKRAN